MMTTTNARPATPPRSRPRQMRLAAWRKAAEALAVARAVFDDGVRSALGKLNDLYADCGPEEDAAVRRWAFKRLVEQADQFRHLAAQALAGHVDE